MDEQQAFEQEDIALEEAGEEVSGLRGMVTEAAQAKEAAARPQEEPQEAEIKGPGGFAWALALFAMLFALVMLTPAAVNALLAVPALTGLTSVEFKHNKDILASQSFGKNSSENCRNKASWNS